MRKPSPLDSEFSEVFSEYAGTLDCVHCGLCISHCPTYLVTTRETDSPRGRIYLMRHNAESGVELTPDAQWHLDQCIVCRACETACPSGVQMGHLMEAFRHDRNLRLEKTPSTDRGQHGRTLGERVQRAFGRFLLQQVLPFRKRIARLSDLIYAYQISGLRRLAQILNRRVFRSRSLEYLDRLQPVIPPPSIRRIATDRVRPEHYPPVGKARMRVGLFLGCITSEWFAPTHHATIRVLQQNGCEVVVPEAQTCCGALHRHAGFTAEAASLLRRNLLAFNSAGVDVVVVNAAGCGASLKEPPGELGAEYDLQVRDICEFLDEVGITRPSGVIDRTVVYDQPCHLLHGQRVGGQVVERVLAQIPGLRLLPLPGSEDCCGSGGVYNLLHPEMAEPIGAAKAAGIIRTGADIVVTGNPGCALQIRAALGDAPVTVCHPMDLLDASYQARDLDGV